MNFNSKKVDDLVSRIENLQKFAKKLNDVAAEGGQDIVIQLHRPLTPEQYQQLASMGRASGVMEIGTPDGQVHFEKPVARLKVNLDDIRPILGELVSHCLMRSKEVYEATKEEVK